MPKKPLKPCSYPGCPNLTEGRYCEEHKKLREKQYNKYHRDKVVQSIYNSKEWKMLRRKKLELNPECEQCLREDRITRATMVDHIVPIKKGGGVFSMSNLKACAGTATAENQLRKAVGGKIFKKVYRIQ